MWAAHGTSTSSHPSSTLMESKKTWSKPDEFMPNLLIQQSMLIYLKYQDQPVKVDGRLPCVQVCSSVSAC